MTFPHTMSSPALSSPPIKPAELLAAPDIRLNTSTNSDIISSQRINAVERPVSVINGGRGLLGAQRNSQPVFDRPYHVVAQSKWPAELAQSMYRSEVLYDAIDSEAYPCYDRTSDSHGAGQWRMVGNMVSSSGQHHANTLAGYEVTSFNNDPSLIGAISQGRYSKFDPLLSGQASQQGQIQHDSRYLPHQNRQKVQAIDSRQDQDNHHSRTQVSADDFVGNRMTHMRSLEWNLDDTSNELQLSNMLYSDMLLEIPDFQEH